MYLLELATVLICVYLAPALALRPSLALKPESAIAIPFLSVAVVVAMQSGLSVAGLFNPAVVRSLTMALLMVAAFRFFRAHSAECGKNAWQGYPKLVVLLNLALVIYFGAAIFLYGFGKDDEIYSWNMWAIQEFLGEDTDFYYTRAPYPQLFPKMLSWGYMLLGNLESQIAVKTALVVFPFSIYSIWALASGAFRPLYLALHVTLAVFVIREIGLKDIMDDGMPDTMAAAAILASIYFINLYRRARSQTEYFWLSLICACVGALSKQPALIWALFSLPAILLTDLLRGKERPLQLLKGLLPAACAISWMLTEGRNFQDNQGVLSRSIDERSPWDQLLLSTDLYILQEPLIAILAVLAIVSVARSRRGTEILLLFAFPSIGGWFFFANYDFRAGFPALVTLTYLVAYGGYCFEKRGAPLIFHTKPGKTTWSIGIILLALSLNNLYSDIVKHIDRNDGYELGQGPSNNLYEMFQADALTVRTAVIDNEKSVLWAPSNYVYGVFYGYSIVVRPNYDGGYSAKKLINELIESSANFASDGGRVAFGPGGRVLRKVIDEDCPELFSRLAGPNNEHGISIYRVDNELILTDYCRP